MSKNFSKYLSYLLRHNPSDIGLYMDSEGWVSVDELLNRLDTHNKYKVSLDELKEVVNTDEKQRYSFKDNFKYIRANQGHSLPDVNIQFKSYIPTDVLFHGTASHFLDRITSSGGLKPMSRLYVHLSKDITTAEVVGKRHGKVKILVVDAKAMHEDGFDFLESDNGVILVKEVPNKYIKIM